MKTFEKVIIIVCAVAVVLVGGLWTKKQLSSDGGKQTRQAEEPAADTAPAQQQAEPSSEAKQQETQAATAAPAPSETEKQEEAPKTEKQNETPENEKHEDVPAETPTEAPAASAVPQGTDAVLKAFNDATAKASSSASFTKTKKSELTSYTIEGESLDALKKVGGSIYDSLSEKTVMGTLNVGEETENAAKGAGGAMLIPSTLTAADVRNASAADNGTSYTVTIEVVDSVNPGTQPIPMEKFSKDFLVLEDIQKYGAEKDLTVIAAEATISNTVIKATIDTASGNLTDYSVSYSYEGALTDCNYKFLGKTYKGLHGSGALSVSVVYSSFAY